MLLVNLQQIDYLAALDLQYKIVDRKIHSPAPDVLLVLEHPHTITLGARGRRSDVLVSEECLVERGIAVHVVDRGGEATYHGPGQLVCYPVVDLKARSFSARSYVRVLEDTILAALYRFEVAAFLQTGKVGVWTGENQKIASIGVRIKRRVTYHGFSLNVDLELDPSDYVVSCGMPLVRMVDLRQASGKDVSLESARRAIAESFATVFGVDLEPCSWEDLHSLLRQVDCG
jgi:lipoate-protein ligase B